MNQVEELLKVVEEAQADQGMLLSLPVNLAVAKVKFCVKLLRQKNGPM